MLMFGNHFVDSTTTETGFRLHESHYHCNRFHKTLCRFYGRDHIRYGANSGRYRRKSEASQNTKGGCRQTAVLSYCWRFYAKPVRNFVRTDFNCSFATLSHARQGETQTPSLLDLWARGVNCAAARYLRRSPSLFGPPVTRSRRGTGFRRIHAAHPAKSLTSAQFLTPENPVTLRSKGLSANDGKHKNNESKHQ